MVLRPLDDPADGRSIPLDLEGDEGPYLRSGLSPDGGRIFVISASGRVFLFEVPTGRRSDSIEWPVIKGSEAGKFTIRSAALSTGGRRFAVSTEQSEVVQLFESGSGREIQLIGHRDFVSGVAFSPDGEMLATGSVDATIKLWSAKDGRNIATLTGHMEEATDVGFSPDGRTLASVGFHSTVMFWHVPTFRELAALDFPMAGFHLVFSPDGEALAVTTGAQENEGVEIFAAPGLP
jgi:WD40 repeat protein